MNEQLAAVHSHPRANTGGSKRLAAGGRGGRVDPQHLGRRSLAASRVRISAAPVLTARACSPSRSAASRTARKRSSFVMSPIHVLKMRYPAVSEGPGQ